VSKQNSSELNSRIRILLLEDDSSISDIISEFLEECGYDVSLAYDGEEAIDKTYEEHFDALVLDVKVPLKNGFDVLRELRDTQKSMPAIFITSLASIDDLAMGYDAGCDDYIKKPFELKELQLRLDRLIKKSFSLDNENKIILNDVWSFLLNNSKLISKNRELFLTKKEAKILKTLLLNKNKVVSNNHIIDEAWGYNDDVTGENLRTHIKKLRKILGKEMIINIRQQGYMLALS
jgi:OmpR-family two-component system manganese-sensing response regulator